MTDSSESCIRFQSTRRCLKDAFSGELQHLFRSRYFNLTSGVGYFDIRWRADVDCEGYRTFTPPLDPLGYQHVLSSDTDLKHVNVYAYSYINLLKNVTFTARGQCRLLSAATSRDSRTKTSSTRNSGLPGIHFRAPHRAAAFRVLKRTLITDQTLEPTQVAGFNQFFDDLNGTDAWRYGGAIDQKFTKDLFGGVEFSKGI